MAKMELSVFPLGTWQGSAHVLLSVDKSVINLLMQYGKARQGLWDLQAVAGMLRMDKQVPSISVNLGISL